jgi:hypothetical protein
MNTSSLLRHRALAVLAGSLMLTMVSATYAAARPDPGGPTAAPTVTAEHHVQSPAPLMRIGTQLVRGDNLTGAGVSAPLWLPEQGLARSAA